MSDDKSTVSVKVSELTSVNVGAVKLAQLGTKFYSGNSVNLIFNDSTGELCTCRNTVERRTKYRF